MAIIVLVFTARGCGNGKRCCRGYEVMGNHGDHCPSVHSKGVWQWEGAVGVRGNGHHCPSFHSKSVRQWGKVL